MFLTDPSYGGCLNTHLSQLVAFIVLALVTGKMQAQAVPKAQLRGRVTTRLSVPLPLAEITVMADEPKTVLTDSSGRFSIGDLSVGRHLVRVRRIGFQAQYLTAKLSAEKNPDFDIMLEPGAVELADVEVTVEAAKPIEYGWTTKYDDFFRRRRSGFGRFITREDIDRKRPWRTSSMLAGVPGVRIRFVTAEVTEVWFSGCGQISVWIDGWKQRYAVNRGAAAIGELIDRLSPLQLEMMEIYTSPAKMPAEFLDDSCGAIVLWTR
jgi:hypothetical protein